MAIATELSQLWEEKAQRDDTFEARAALQNWRTETTRTNALIQAIVDEGSFDTIPTDLKNALLAAWNAVKAADTAMEDADVAEALNWSASS